MKVGFYSPLPPAQTVEHGVIDGALGSRRSHDGGLAFEFVIAWHQAVESGSEFLRLERLGDVIVHSR